MAFYIEREGGSRIVCDAVVPPLDGCLTGVPVTYILGFLHSICNCHPVG